MNWVYLATAPDQLVGEMWSESLRDSGIPAILRQGDTASFLGVSAYPCRLLVDEERLSQARELLKTELGVTLDDEESPYR